MSATWRTTTTKTHFDWNQHDHTPHELAEEFPEAADKIHTLKVSDSHFARLADDYHSINREIHRLETRVETASDAHEADLRKKRIHLKDEIAAILTRG